MARKDYPFDASGNYVTAWASEGESAASNDDVARWQASHGGSVSRRQPSPVTKVSSKKSSSGRTSSYTIKSGDTLGGIARKHSTTVAKIKAANGLKSDMIRAGKTLKIPR
ncbi:D-gamma-glutamyl-meso-diaminopimelic acid endopeptidase CwlS [Prosthecobacter fusiformis]|uniref:D-gamma-glutamyl-meso-diaminopimelic acid endopeptidase CwlS n=1 Tax=Prosthecobacter fusiformis TaxID=48464 RepID=A0A4R7RUE4_9BACT|nr:LysM peptidoglycan-binding domain-containing protein [Prosthecobacter fusiformis]TDU69362.1 D-gamma-glutamyl-meso-diaminopimelic acid endopeptidase CwlS [Prosthecobacter fusiformis]